MTDGIWISLITAGVTAFFLLGVPIFLVIGLWVVGTSLVIDFTLANVGVTLFQGLSFFGLLALPLFILTGDLINAAGIAKRLSDFAYSTLSWMRGGMGMSTLGACGLFAAISGSSVATAATIGTVAMLWVGGSILVHGLHDLGWHLPYEQIKQAAKLVAEASGSATGFVTWAVTAGLDGIIGLACGLALIPLVTRALVPVSGWLFPEKA